MDEINEELENEDVAAIDPNLLADEDQDELEKDDEGDEMEGFGIPEDEQM